MVRIFACFALVTVLSCSVFAQSNEKPLTFELADVHVSPPTALAALAAMSGGVPRGGRYELRNASMQDLIRTAYGVEPEKVVGGPNWLASDRFDVIAKVPSGVTQETARIMLQALLAERFSLKVHNDSRPLPVFVLSAGKGRHKMKESDGSQSGCQGQPQQAPQPGVIPYAQVSCHNLTTAQIAENLRQMAGGYLDKPVIDQTKIEGAWDFDIKWTARAQLGAAGADGISIFDAVDKQLGLKLEQQQISMPVIVVDNVNQKPTDNAPGVAESLPPEKPEFEAAEIKPPAPDAPPGVGIRYTQGGRIDATGSLRNLIGIALEIPPNLANDLLVGGPKFLDTERYNIVAKAPSTGIGAPNRTGGRETPPPIGVALMMLRALLEDRFKLATHKETQQATAYAFLPPKGELKLKKASPSDRAECKPDPGAVSNTTGGLPMVAFTCQNTTIEELAKNISQWAGAYIDHPAVDATGLQGGWNFTLSWTPRQALENASRPADGAAGAAGIAADPGGITVFQAVEKQLGLKLEKGTHPVSVTVIDHVEQKPTD
jgi:uncharacterized protein (TIGR03435 family)